MNRTPQAVPALTGFDPGRGDIVQLKSGGPKMVAINKVDDGFYCQYFDRLGRSQTSYFLVSNLIPA